MRHNGFTLVELAVVLAVASVAMAVIAPDFIASRRISLAERSASEMNRIIDAAKWYYHDSNVGDPALDRLWPGQRAATDDVDDDAAADCMAGVGPDCPVALLPGSMFTNPWGFDYRLRVIQEAWVVESAVPTEVAGVIEASVPGGLCEVRSPFCGDLPVPTGFVACCAIAPRPGREAYVASMGMTETTCEDLGGSFDPATRECETMSFSPANCGSFGDVCPEGYVMRGIDVNRVSSQVRCCRNP